MKSPIHFIEDLKPVSEKEMAELFKAGASMSRDVSDGDFFKCGGGVYFIKEIKATVLKYG